MFFKSNSTLTLCLAASLLVAVIIIFSLVFFRKTSSESEHLSPERRPEIHPQGPQGPPHQGTPQGTPPQGQGIPQGTPPSPPSLPPTLALFHSDSCGHCKHMMPAWNKVAATLQKERKIAVIGINDKQHADKMRESGISGLPEVRFYPEGFPSSKFSEYRGDRSFESILRFAQSGGSQS